MYPCAHLLVFVQDDVMANGENSRSHVQVETCRRRSLRLRDYNYSQPGAYFVTICTHQRLCLLGEIAPGTMCLSDSGSIVWNCWHRLVEHYPDLELDAFVIMPNHVHGVLALVDPVGAGLKPAPTFVYRRHGLTEIVRAFKTFSSRRINQLRGTPGRRVWQRGYYEHVIRNEADLHEIRQYVVNSPLKWELDEENPETL